MTNLRYTRYFAAFIFILILSGNSSANTISTYPKLTMHGQSYENSCSRRSKEKLITNIRKNIVHDTRSLQKIIEFILCGDLNSFNIKRMTNLINDLVLISYEGTGEEKTISETRKSIDIVRTIMAGGRAWDATLIFDESDVKLQYFSNEACVKSVTLRHLKNSWLVHEIGEACD